LHANADIGMAIPTYVFATPVLGGQASVSLVRGYGVSNASLNGTVAGSVTGPLGNSIPSAAVCSPHPVAHASLRSYHYCGFRCGMTIWPAWSPTIKEQVKTTAALVITNRSGELDQVHKY
jgi:hypothetical protein